MRLYWTKMHTSIKDIIHSFVDRWICGGFTAKRPRGQLYMSIEKAMHGDPTKYKF